MGSLTGRNFAVLTFGESHGPALGAVIDGLPAGLKIGQADIQRDLDRRRPGQSPFSSPRLETDSVEILSGLAGGLTNGSPLALLIRNNDAKSEDYSALAQAFRPGHADWTYFKKYGLPPQPGGGRSSGRETAARVAAGAVARALLGTIGLTVKAASGSIGPVRAIKRDWAFAEKSPLRFLDPDLNNLAEEAVTAAIQAGDSVGSMVELAAEGVPAGWGDPVFDKLEARLGGALFSIGAVKAVEFGQALELYKSRGSQANSPLGPHGPVNNFHGGVLGGISTGQPIVIRLFIKPTPSILIAQDTTDQIGRGVKISVKGRPDPCLSPRIAPVAEAMALITLADCYLASPSRLS
jgi:chorismate synthase